MYGNWAEAKGSVCHSYTAGNLIYPALSHPHSGNVLMTGTSLWGTGSPTC